MKKRFISLVVASVLALSSAVSIAAEKDENHEYVSDILAQLSIAEHEVFYEPNEEIKRSDFALLVARLRGYNGEEINESPFLDVNTEHYSANAVTYLKSIGVFEGYEDNTFRGEKTITYREAMKVLVEVLGYEKHAEMAGGWGTGYAQIAASLGLNDGVTVGMDAEITQSQAMRIIYNALDTNICDPQISGSDDIRLVTDSGKTPMSQWLDIAKTKGVVTHVGNASVSHDSQPSNTLTVNGVNYYLGEFDALYALGYYCEVYYYDEDSDKADEVAALAILPSKNNTIVINTDDVESFEDGLLVYTKDNKLSRVRITTNDEMSLNGQAVAGDNRQNAVLNSDGEIIINEIMTGDIGVVVMISAYETYVVSGVESDEYTVYARYGKTLRIDEQSDVFVYDADRNKIDFSEIIPSDVLTVKGNSDKTLFEIYVSKTVKDGTFTGKFEDNGTYYTIANADYKLTPEYITHGTKPDVGANVTAHLDVFGRIAYLTATKNDFSYGFICKVTPDELDENIFLIKLYTSKGEFKTYYTTEKIKVDNERVQSSAGFVAMIERGNDGASVNQLVRFRLNSEEKITEIDTAYHNKAAGESENTLQLMHQGYSATGEAVAAKKMIYKPSNSFDHKIVLQSATVGMTVAKTYVNTDKIFKIGRQSYVNGLSYSLNAYKADTMQLYPDVVITYSDSVDDVYDNLNGVIKSVEDTIDVDGERILKIIAGTHSGRNVEYLTAQGELLDDIVDESGAHTLKPGDFVDIKVNVVGEVVGMELLYDAGNRTWLPNKENKNLWGSFHNENAICGTAYKTDNNMLQLVVYGTTLSNDETKFADMIRTVEAGSAKVYSYDRETGRVKDASLNEVRNYYDGTAGASTVVVSATTGAQIGMIVIYK